MTATGRVLALDPGAVRVGVSVTDSARTMAFPRAALAANESLVEQVRLLVEEEAAVHLVVGLPRSLDGTEGPAAKSSRVLAAALQSVLSLEIELFDERLTTVQAAASLRAAGRGSKEARDVIDSAAATVLLEAWLEAR